MATKYKNIVGSSFPDYVKEQLQARQKLVSQTNRSSTALQFLTNRNSFVRLSSGVLTKDNQNGSTNTLAKNNVLQGGLVTINNNTATFNKRYSIGPTDNLGFKPNPGITNLSIGTGGRWQTLLQADIEFVCYDLDQLDIMSKLYMSLGCHVFLEWGHIPYIDNSGNLQKNITTLDFFHNQFNKTNQVIRKINQLRKDSKGNYDALLGRVYNFDFNSNPDGTYNCKIQVMGPGQMIESIKVNAFSNIDYDKTETNESIKYSSTLENSLVAIQKFLENSGIAKKTRQFDAVSGGTGIASVIDKGVYHNLGKIDNENFFLSLVSGSSYGELLDTIYSDCSYPGPKFDRGGVNYNNNEFVSYGNAHQIVANIENNTDDLSTIPLNFYAGYASLTNTEESSDNQYTTYITLGHLFTLIQHVGIFTESPNVNTSDNDTTPVIYLDYHPDNTIINRGPLEASINPGVCLIPLSIAPIKGKENANQSFLFQEYLKPFNPNLEILEGKKLANFNKNLFQFSSLNKVNNTLGNKSFEGKIFNVLVNLDFAINTLRNLSSNKKTTDVNLEEYLNTILEGINISLGQVNNLRIFFDDNSQCLRVIDEIVTEDIDRNKLLIIPNYGIQSTTYDYSFQSKISPNLASQIVISTQAENSGGLQEFSEDVLTYRKLNDDVEDRFAKKISSPKSIKNIDEEKFKKPLQSFFNHLFNCYSNISNEIINPETISSNANIYKDLQNTKRKFLSTPYGNVLIPLEYSITIDGISGILPYNAFVVPNDRLPKKYRGINGNTKVAFAVFSINHNFENNQWTTTLRGQTLLIDKVSLTETN
jgi:hypothetical protein